MRCSSCTACSRGIFVMRPTIPGMLFLPLGRFRYRLEFAVVPGVPKFADLGNPRRWKMINEPVLQSQAESGRTDMSQRDVVARHIDLKKSVTFFKVCYAVRLFFSIGEVRVHEIFDSPVCAQSHCFGDQRIRGSLIPMPDHGDNVHQSRLRPGLIAHQFDKTNQLLFEKCANEYATLGESSLLRAHLLDVHPKMSEWPSLADGTLVVNLRDSAHECVIERYLSDRHTLLTRLLRFIPGLEAELVRPPIVIR